LSHQVMRTTYCIPHSLQKCTRCNPAHLFFTYRLM
jgi:hypothetical protein